MNSLVVGSGGIKGFCYLGACKVLLEMVQEDIDVYIGCSIGAFVTTLLASGYTPTELFSEFLSSGFEDMVQWGTLDDMIKRMGLFDKAPMEEYLQQLLERKLEGRNITYSKFFEMTGKDLYTIAVDTERMEKVVFGKDTHPDTSVVTGVVASCSIPFIIQSTVLGKSMFVDGAAMDPLGLETALAVSEPGGKIYALFFTGTPLATTILSPPRMPSEGSVGEILEYWKRLDVLTPVYRKDAVHSIDRILQQGKRVFRCFMESLMENYVFRYILENQAKDSPRDIVLIPLPNFDLDVLCSPEMKVHMYYTGVDVVSAMAAQKYLS